MVPISATLSINDFAPYLNAVFEMRAPGGIVPLKARQDGILGYGDPRGPDPDEIVRVPGVKYRARNSRKWREKMERQE